METSGYQQFKQIVLDLLPLSKDAVHVHLGFAIFVTTVLVLRRPMRSFGALVPGLVVAALMEVLDLRDDLATTGDMGWGASLKDMINTNLIPVAIVLLARWRDRTRDDDVS